MNQQIKRGYQNIGYILKKIKTKKFLLVCDDAFRHLNFREYFLQLGIPYIEFNDFTPNPLYEDMCEGIRLFSSEECDCIVAVGGGSPIDVAKCIKLFCKMNSNQNYLLQEFTDTGIPLISLPTTAGTGSESTRYAVIYYKGEKQSITHESILPNYAILEPNVLKTLPCYQKKCTALDALCQGIESWWSVNSTEESKEYSQIAVKMIIENINNYIYDTDDGAAEKMMLAANYAGRAINITQTTAVHAMSYKLTSMYGLPHGHAVAICLPKVWRYMNENLDKCIDTRGNHYLSTIFSTITHFLGFQFVEDAIQMIEDVLDKFEIKSPKISNTTDYNFLAQSVNILRLENNPVFLNEKSLYTLYKLILPLYT